MEGGEVSEPLNARNYPFRNRRWIERPQLLQLLRSCQRRPSKLKDRSMHAQTVDQLVHDKT